MGEENATAYARVCSERDLYRRLLHLGGQRELRPFLAEALGLIVESTGARRGYLELYEPDAREGDGAWWIAHDLSAAEVSDIRVQISRGIIAEALATGQTVITSSALLDPRFQERASVRLGRIEGVLCAPIGADPPRGVLYLAGRQTADLYTEEDRERAEVFAEHLAPLVDRLLAELHGRAASDPTRPLRQTLNLSGVIGRSASLASVLKQVALVAPLDIHVLLTGESGTGKTQLARVIHDNGPRAGQPFAQINCGALPETLVESELFGALPGAHSTASRRIEGKVAAAENGTLFLDEIGDLTLAAQAKLLELLQSKEYYPLGAARPTRANVRVIAATNKDLDTEVAQRRFRDDLYYRLNVIQVRVPSLAERRSDIPDLAAYFCAAACQRYALAQVVLSGNALRALEAAPWPGNVRQLAHVVEAAVIRAAGGGATQVERADLFSDAPAAADADTLPTFQEATRRFQATLVRDALAETGWNIVETARRLDLTRSHIYNLIRAFGLERHGQ